MGGDVKEYGVFSRMCFLRPNESRIVELNYRDTEVTSLVLSDIVTNTVVRHPINLADNLCEEQDVIGVMTDDTISDSPQSDSEYCHVLSEENRDTVDIRNDYNDYEFMGSNNINQNFHVRSILNIELSNQCSGVHSVNSICKEQDDGNVHGNVCEQGNESISDDLIPKKVVGDVILLEKAVDKISKGSQSNCEEQNGKEKSGIIFLESLISSKAESYACWICRCVFDSQMKLTDHESVHMKQNGRLQCPHCETTCMNNKYLKIHLQMHTSFKTYQCEICHKTFKRKSNMENHLSNHVNDFHCSVCSNSYNTQFCLSRHLAVHSEDAINASKTNPHYVLCDFMNNCKQKFYSKLKYHNHKKDHMNIVDYKCDKCFKIFKSASILASHKKIHESSNGCEICGKLLSNQKTLKEHMRIHTGELPYECKYCGQKFRCQSFLAVHILAHTGIRNYKCRFCRQTFTRSTYLKEHLRTHNNDKPFICKYCDQRYTQSSVLKKHVTTMHRKCDICNVIIGDKIKLQVHKWKLHSNKNLDVVDNTDTCILRDDEAILIVEETVVEV